MTTNTLSRSITVKELFLGSLQLICVVCGVLQFFIDNRYDNLIPTVMVVVTSSMMIQYMRISESMTTHPLSSLALIGFTVSSQFGALITQSLDGAPFTHLLRAPMLTFSVLGGVHLIAIGTHWVYRHFKPFDNASHAIANHVVTPLGGHTIPPLLTVWILGGIGFLATASGGGQFGDVGGKFFAGLAFLIWLPFLIPIYHRIQGADYSDIKKQIPLIFSYAALIVALALLKNFRALMFGGPVQLFFIYLVHLCRTPNKVTRTMLQTVVGVIVILGLSMSSLSDLMTAMEIARAKRDSAAAREVVEETYKTFIDKDKLMRYRQSKEMASVLDLYDENYLHNPMLARFTETKFHDNMLYFASRMDDSARDEILENLGIRVLAILPQNILDALDIKLKKEKYVFSMGDLYLSLDTGSNMGGFVTGSIWADCLVVAGSWFPFLVSLMLMLTFIMLDSLSRFGPGLYISPVATCTIWHIYLYGVGGESLSFKLTQLIRDIPQKILLYAICFFLVTAMLKLFGIGNKATPPQELLSRQ